MAVFDTSATTTANGIVFDFAVATLQAIPTTVDVGQSIILSIDEDRPGATVTYFANDTQLTQVTGGNGYEHEWVTDTAGSYTVRAEITDAGSRQHRTQSVEVVIETPVTDFTFNTMDEALAANPTPQVGDLVEVEGYHEPGDGGGGLFEVTDSGAETDGGTVFAFYEDQSSEEELATTAPFTSSLNLPHADLIWESLTITFDDERPPLTVLDHMSGHGSGSYTWVDFKTGTLGGSETRFGNVKSWADTDELTIRYRYATSERRLVRQKVRDAVNMAWWGAVPADPNDPVNSRGPLTWVINKAAEIYEEGDHDWVYVDIPDEYYYRYEVEIRDGVVLRGSGDDIPGSELPDGTFARGKLKLMPELAANHLRLDFDDSPYAIYEALSAHSRDLISNSDRNDKIGIDRLELDGNMSEQPMFDNPEDYQSNFGNRVQTAGAWTGYSTRGTPGVTQGQAIFTNSYIHDFPGNGIVNNERFDFSSSDNMRIGRAPRNHQMYNVTTIEGELSNFVVEGASWDMPIRENNGVHKNITYRNAEPMLDHWPWAIESVPGGNTWGIVFHHETRHGPDTFWEIDGFTVDLSDGNDRNVNLFDLSGGGGVFRNGVVTGQPDHNTGLISPRNNKGLDSGYLLENITMEDIGGGIGLAGGWDSRVTMRNITVNAAEGIVNSGLIGPRSLAKGPETTDDVLSQPARLYVENLVSNQVNTGGFLQPSRVNVGDMPWDIFIDGMELNNDVSTTHGERIFHHSTGDAIENLYGFWSYRLFLHECTFNVGDRFIHNERLFTGHRVIRLRNCQDREGRVSDNSGNFTSSSADEGNDFVLIETSLMSRAMEHELNITTAPSGVSILSVDIANSDGSLRSIDVHDQRDPYLRVNFSDTIGSGEVVEIEWATRVTPLHLMSRTGMFIARRLDYFPDGADFVEHTYNLADGSIEIDLRGVAATFESDEQVQYSASSDDTDVVEANVQADGYTLILAPQSVGTTSISITGEIAGVGSATDTFEVTVE